MPTGETDTSELVPLQAADEEEGGGDAAAAAAAIKLSALRVGKAAECSYVELRAPSDLPPHYEVAVELPDGRRTTVVVPVEGARKGKTFRALLVGEFAGLNDNNSNRRKITGRWRVGLCDGFWWVCVPALCCLNCMVGRIMEREKLNVCADRRRSKGQDSGACGPLAVLGIGTLVGLAFDLYVDAAVSSHAAHAEEMALLNSALRFVGGLYLWYVVARTRGHIRRARQIEGSGCDDCLLAGFCTICTVGQMDQEEV